MSFLFGHIDWARPRQPTFARAASTSVPPPAPPRRRYVAGSKIDLNISPAAERLPNTLVPLSTEEKAQNKWNVIHRRAMESLKAHPVPNASSGRAVRVISGDIAKAFDKLSNLLKNNSIKQEVRMGSRHEKKGVKRRRLASETWRRVFANEVRRSVQLVAKIRRRGA